MPKELELAPEVVRNALAHVLAAPEFRQANRLREFLSYVVNETASGRGALISGRTIAQDVYNRGQSENDSDLSVVRVDAGRLRRRLVEYYSDSGATDPVRISIPTGSYAPVIEKREMEVNSTDSVASGNRGFRTVAVLALIGVLVVALFMTYERLSASKLDQSAIASKDAQSATRIALLQKSPATLQAVNQAEQARGLMFPAPDPVRLGHVLGMFEHVIELDSSYFGGHAGAAQAAGMLGGLAPDSPYRSRMLEAAEKHSKKALVLRPESSWVQSAAAWVAFASRDFDTAQRMSSAAVSLDKTDLFARELGALIALFSGNFDAAIDLGDPAAFVGETTGRKTNRNAFGVAHYYLGNYEIAVTQLEEVIRRGEPVSEVSIFYLVAAHQELGNFGDARAFVRYYNNAWPEGRVDLLLKRIFVSPNFVDVPLASFRAAGGLKED